VECCTAVDCRHVAAIPSAAAAAQVYDYGIMLLPDGVDQVFMVCCAALVGFFSCWLSNRYKLDASMRLFVITFLIVSRRSLLRQLQHSRQQGCSLFLVADNAVGKMSCNQHSNKNTVTPSFII
jgi:hypothetical protein